MTMTPTEIEKLKELALVRKKTFGEDSFVVVATGETLSLIAALEAAQARADGSADGRDWHIDNAAELLARAVAAESALEAKDAEIERARELSAQSNRLRDEWRTEALNLRLELERKGHSLEAAEAALKEAREALEPFAEIGVWLFARDLPDDDPVFEFSRLNAANGKLTRGHFKAAHSARLHTADEARALLSKQ